MLKYQNDLLLFLLETNEILFKQFQTIKYKNIILVANLLQNYLGCLDVRVNSIKQNHSFLKNNLFSMCSIMFKMINRLLRKKTCQLL